MRDLYNISSGLVSGDLPEDGIDYLELYRVDHENAAQLGLNIFRIGVEWGRVFPHPTWFVDVDVERDGNGFVRDVKITDEVLRRLDRIANRDAVNLYREIVLDLRKRGFKVIVNLWHFTIPYWLHDPLRVRSTNLAEGPKGLLEDIFPVEFAKFAAYLAYRLGDIVDFWSTMNEPMVPIELGYMSPRSGFPPGVDRPDAIPKAFVNMIQAHALAYRQIKKLDTVRADPDSRAPSEVGIIHNFIPAYPLDGSSESASDHYNYLHNYMLFEAITKGKVDLGLDGKNIVTLASAQGTLDWIGVNYYTRLVVRKREEKASSPILDFEVVPGYGFICIPSGISKAGRWCSEMGWEMFPEGFVDALDMASKYSDNLYITENGVSDRRDISRAKFIVSHLYAALKTVEHGLKIQGYLYWSLNDNYEWAHGFGQRFGLFEVDLVTKERRPRASAKVFKEVVANNALKKEHLDMVIYEDRPPRNIL